MRQQDPVTTNQPPKVRDYFLAYYPVSLTQGETINGILIKYSTIKKYLEQAYTIFGNLPYNSEHNFVTTILKVVKDYKEVPCQSLMITNGMMLWLIAEA